MSRLQAGDVVVLNGHRLTVEGPESSAGIVMLANRQGDSTPRAIPGAWLPDPEPREEPPALTPGMTVAHRDGRLGMFESQNSIDFGLTWRAFGSALLTCSPPGSLRPVTLVEKPDREAAIHAIVAAFGATGGHAAGRIYDALFPPDNP